MYSDDKQPSLQYYREHFPALESCLFLRDFLGWGGVTIFMLMDFFKCFKKFSVILAWELSFVCTLSFHMNCTDLSLGPDGFHRSKAGFILACQFVSLLHITGLILGLICTLYRFSSYVPWCLYFLTFLVYMQSSQKQFLHQRYFNELHIPLKKKLHFFPLLTFLLLYCPLFG